MSKGKTLEAIISIAGSIDPSLQKSLNGVNKKFGGMKKGLAVAGVAAAAAGAAVVKFGADAVKSAATYQKQMANVSTLLDGSTDQVKQRVSELSDQMLKVSNSTGVATSDLSDGLYQMISAVGDSKDVSKQVELAAKAAQAGGSTTTDSINLLSAVTKAYGDTSYESMSKVSDLAFTTVKLGQTTFPELAASMKQVTGQSKTLGVKQEELFGVMATATGVTGDTAAVATQLKAVYTNLLKPSTAMSKALSSMGYSSGQAAVQQLGLQGTLDALSKSCDGDASAMASMFSSSEALNLALGLTGNLSESLTEKTAAMEKATGATDTAFERQTDTLDHTIQSLKNMGKNFMTSVGNKILPVVEKAAKALLPEVSAALDKIGPVIDGIYQSLSPLITAIGGEFASMLPGMSSGLSGMLDIWTQMQQPIANLAQSLFPIMQNVLGAWLSLWTQLQPVISTFIANLFPQIAAILQALAPIIQVVTSALSPIFSMVGQLVSSLLPAITAVINFLIPNIQMLASIVGSVLGNAFQIVIPIIQNVVNVISSLLDFVTNVFTGNWSAAWENVKSIFSNVFDALVGLAKVPINAVVGIINGVISGINNCGITIPDWVPGIGGKGFHIDIPNLPTFATGGFTTGTSIAGEDGQEAVISFNSRYRDENLSYWAKAGRMLGVDDAMLSTIASGSSGSSGGAGSPQFTFAPKVIVQGSASKQDIIEAIRKEEEEFMDMVEEMMSRRGGEKYGFNY